MLRILSCFLILCIGNVLSQGWGTWGNYIPSNTAATRERSRNCTPTATITCRNDYFMEMYTGCANLQCGNSVGFINEVASSCSGVCDLATSFSTLTCSTEAGCTLKFVYQCLGTCTGTWATWTTSSCSQNCGSGTRTRSRLCKDVGGNVVASCEGGRGSSVQNVSESCNTISCPVFSTWSSFSSCSKSCDSGSYTRTRDCLAANGPSPQGVGCGANNLNQETDTQVCNGDMCPYYTAWQNGTCSETCGPGSAMDTRTCMYLSTVSSLCPGAQANGVQTVTSSCNAGLCPTWSQWTNNGGCSQTCGQSGTVQQVQTCYIGTVISTLCVGSGGQTTSTRNVPCNIISCPTYGSFIASSVCNTTCGQGYQTYTKTCMFNGGVSSACVNGSIVSEIRNCNLAVCQFGAWSNITQCTNPCGGGTKVQTQQCITPGCHLPNNNQTVSCNNIVCQFGAWSNITQCTTPCGGGTKVQTQQCITPGCHLPNNNRTISCNTHKCTFGPWFDVSSCSAVCGGGTKNQQRDCVLPSACGNATQTQTVACNVQPCTFGPWNDTSSCSLTCGGGSKAQQRKCTITNCSITENRTTTCNSEPCIIVTAGFSNLPLLIAICAIAGGVLISAIVYMCVSNICGAAAGAGAPVKARAVTASTAFTIYAIQAATLGMILWRGQTKLKVKSGGTSGCCACCGGSNVDEQEGSNKVPMVRLFGNKKNPATVEEGLPSTSANVNISTPTNDDVGLQELTNWAEHMIADSSNIDETDVYELNKSNNNCIWAINDDRIHVTHYAWIHTRSFSKRPLSTFQPLERCDSHTYAEMQ
ncbi:uncharacterized protein LOC101241942 isoform X2 [Ciona intestinalis]